MPAKASRDAFGEAVARLGEKYTDVVVLDADLAKSTKSEIFAKKFPDRFFEMGIQEANMIGVGAGLALSGKIPFICSFAAFVCGRFDQIKLSIAYSHANVRVVGSHAGVGIGEDGYSQQGLEDIACMRSLPNMAVIQPADGPETEAAVEYLITTHKGPAFLRTTRQKLEQVTGEGYRFEFGKAVKLREGSDLAIFATGGTVQHAVKAHESLKAQGIAARVVNVHTLKPIDRDAIIDAAKSCKGGILTVEDHQIVGGLGSAVAEVLAESGIGAKLYRHGLDAFGESGTPEELYAHFELDAAGIEKRAKAFLGR
ncbi:MAG: transketolase family protein [Myxococcales bacterium]